MEEYKDFIAALFERHPSVSSVGFSSGAYKPGLQGMLSLDALMGYPSRRLRFIHVAGTNGKGSVCSMLASALSSLRPSLGAEGAERRRNASPTGSLSCVSETSAPSAALSGTGSGVFVPERGAEGLSGTESGSFVPGPVRVGLYTSPHLLDFRERIKIVSDSGYEMISEQEVLEFWEKYGEECDRLGLSFFEITTGMALDWFASKKVDVAVLETGLGGRLDSTNIVTPVLSVITSIGLDHCALLGSTRAEIAAEKAGIFKKGVPALVWGCDPETDPVFEERAAALPCPLIFADEDLASAKAGNDLPYPLDLKGEYQARNLKTVIAALKLLGIDPDSEIIKKAIANAAKRTGLMGRWEVLRDEPLTICDIAHNPPALKLNFAQLDSMMESGRFDHLFIIFGIMADKALGDIIPLMPRNAQYFFVTPDTPRALPAAEIAKKLSETPGAPSQVTICGSVEDGIKAVERFLPEKSIVYIGGSTYVVCQALKYFES